VIWIRHPFSRNDSYLTMTSFIDTPSFPFRLTKEITEANKKMKDGSVASDKKTFLKAQIPKMETEIKTLKSAVQELLDSEEIDPRGEYYLLGKKLTK